MSKVLSIIILVASLSLSQVFAEKKKSEEEKEEKPTLSELILDVRCELIKAQLATLDSGGRPYLKGILLT